jgi:hypothetical protein
MERVGDFGRLTTSSTVWCPTMKSQWSCETFLLLIRRGLSFLPTVYEWLGLSSLGSMGNVGEIEMEYTIKRTHFESWRRQLLRQKDPKRPTYEEPLFESKSSHRTI